MNKTNRSLPQTPEILEKGGNHLEIMSKLIIKIMSDGNKCYKNF